MGADERYRQRVLDGELAERLSAIGAVLIEGPKACGKTETASQKATTAYRFDVDQDARNAASVAPDVLLDNPSRCCSMNGRSSPPCGTGSAAPSTTAPLPRGCTS